MAWDIEEWYGNTLEYVCGHGSMVWGHVCMVWGHGEGWGVDMGYQIRALAKRLTKCLPKG